MNIIDFIPFGKENAITREQLSAKTGRKDRVNRELISKERRDHAIVNLQNGAGYYRPTRRDEVALYVKQEEARLKSIGWSLKGARMDLKAMEE